MDYPGKVITKNAVIPTQASAPGVWTLDDAAQAQKANSWPIPGVPNPISKSLRFNSADSAYLDRTPSIESNRRTWTWSGWAKRGTLGATRNLFEGRFNSTNITALNFNSTDTLLLQDYSGSGYNLVWETSAVFRDPSAWYHIVFVYDTTQASSANAVKLYVNGVQQTLTLTAYGGSYTQNRQGIINFIAVHSIGRYNTANYFDGYMTEINFVDGQALTPSDFGMTDTNTGVWIPKKYTGTYGTNGFYVNFKDASNTTTLGYDYSGNGNNWNANNFSVTAGAGNDSLTDVPTPWVGYSLNGDTGGVVRGNYCTLNPLQNALTLANGNLDNTQSGGGAYAMAKSTFGLSTGKWYWEVLITARPTIFDSRFSIGISSPSETTGSYVGSTSGGYGIFGSTSVAADGSKVNNGSFTTITGAGFTTNDVLMFAFDADAGKLWFGKNGTWLESGAPASGTNAQFTSIPAGTYLPAISSYSGTSYTSSASNNFGQRPFAYTPPAGFLSLCTTNLPTPTIVQGDDYYNAVLYTGNGASRTISGVGFQPDFVWVKVRSTTGTHVLSDAVRGGNKQLFSNLDVAEGTATNKITGFASDGFTLGADDGTGTGDVNFNGSTYVAWNWKANGTGTTNTSGTITSTVSANTTSGFSIVTYTGTGSASDTVGHGLGVVPAMVITKRRNSSGNWMVKHKSLSSNNNLILETTLAQTNVTTGFTSGGIADLSSSTTFGFLNGTGGNPNNSNTNTGTYVAYCFAEIAGFSAFGSYTGNGSNDGPFIYTGFRVAYLFTKRINTTGDWYIWDDVRSTYNPVALNIWPNYNSAEYNYGADGTQPWDFLSNGFKARVNSIINNNSGDTYIYAAFAENPFKYALAR